MLRWSFASSVVLLLASASLAACSSGAQNVTGDGSPAADAGTSDATVGDAAATTDAATTDAADASTLTLVIEPDQGMTPIYDFIGTAKKTLDMTMYELDDTTATGLLVQAVKNGVTVRVILDQNLEGDTNAAAYGVLADAGATVQWANPTYSATHQKTITVDQTTSAIMTLNFASHDYPTSRDFAVITHDPADVAAIETTFAGDLVDASAAPPTGDDLVWSPTNSQSALLGLIGGAAASLLVENEEMGDDKIVNALIAAAGRGVDVRVAMENSRSYVNQFDALIQAGVKLHTYSSRSPGLYIHAKVILADYGTSTAKVFVGSENFSTASLQYNRELGLITSDPGIMAGIQTTLAGDFDGGTPFLGADAAPPPVVVPDAGTGDAAPDALADAPADALVDAPADAPADAADGASDDAGD